jgi:hypothetical protein
MAASFWNSFGLPSSDPGKVLCQRKLLDLRLRIFAILTHIFSGAKSHISSRCEAISSSTFSSRWERSIWPSDRAGFAPVLGGPARKSELTAPLPISAVGVADFVSTVLFERAIADSPSMASRVATNQSVVRARHFVCGDGAISWKC